MAVYSPTKSPAEILEVIHRRHPSLIRYETHSQGLNADQYVTKVDIPYFNTIKEYNDNQGQSRNVAFQRAVDYLKTLSGWIHDSPHQMDFIE